MVPALTCGGANLVANGDFEAGFVNGVGKGWASFTNGGRAAYGFYDEQWPPVIKSGLHGQLIEINTWGLAASDADRAAGIYQVVTGLKKGVTYEFMISGQMREEAAHSDEDAYRYRVQWGFGSGDPAGLDNIKNWSDLPWDKINVRTSPGAMLTSSVRFVAPSAKIVLGVRALKKWGTVQRELDVNLDAIKLAACGSGGATVIVPGTNGGKCTPYVVQRGDTLGKIGAKYHVTVAAIVAQNKIKNPNLIYVGQKLCIPPDP